MDLSNFIHVLTVYESDDWCFYSNQFFNYFVNSLIPMSEFSGLKHSFGRN